MGKGQQQCEMDLHHYVIDVPFPYKGAMPAPGRNLQENTDLKIAASLSFHVLGSGIDPAANLVLNWHGEIAEREKWLYSEIVKNPLNINLKKNRSPESKT